jgi:hypothetical protein
MNGKRIIKTKDREAIKFKHIHVNININNVNNNVKKIVKCMKNIGHSKIAQELH